MPERESVAADLPPFTHKRNPVSRSQSHPRLRCLPPSLPPSLPNPSQISTAVYPTGHRISLNSDFAPRSSPSTMADVVAMPNQSPYFSATDRRRLAAFAEREGLLLEKSRRTSLPPPIECCVAKLAGNLSEKRVECAILEAVVRSAFLNLHSVEENLAYWESKAQGAHPRKMYFMTFERGPQVFAEIACKAVWNLRSPYKFLLESAAEMNHLIAAQRDALTSIQCCLAKFLREIYYEVEASRKALHEESANPLLALFTIVDKLFRNLDLSLKTVVDKDFGVFERLAVVDVDSSKWSVDMSIEAVGCIYQNIRKFNRAISYELLLHGKPRHVSMYWLPYTCGAIAFAGCSIWLLHKEAGIDADSCFQGAKQILGKVWSTYFEKPVIHVRDQLAESSRGEDPLEKRREEVKIMEEAYARSLLTFCRGTSDQNLPLGADNELLEHVIKSQEKNMSGAGHRFAFMNTFKMAIDPNTYRALAIKVDKLALDVELEMLRGSEKLMKLGLNFAILETLPAVGVFALLVWLLRAHGRRAVATRKTKTRLLLARIERDIKAFERHLAYGELDKAHYNFGMMVSKLDRLSSTVEPHAMRLREWEDIVGDLIDLARPQTSTRDRSDLLKKLKWTYQSTRVL